MVDQVVRQLSAIVGPKGSLTCTQDFSINAKSTNSQTNQLVNNLAQAVNTSDFCSREVLGSTFEREDIEYHN